MWYIFPPVCSGSASGSPPSWMCLKYLHREVSMAHPNQTPQPPQLAPFTIKEQRFYSNLLVDVWTPHPVPKGPKHPVKETHFGPLYLWSHSFCQSSWQSGATPVTSYNIPIHLSISCSIFTSFVNKNQRYLASFTATRSQPKERSLFSRTSDLNVINFWLQTTQC